MFIAIQFNWVEATEPHRKGADNLAECSQFLKFKTSDFRAFDRIFALIDGNRQRAQADTDCELLRNFSPVEILMICDL